MELDALLGWLGRAAEWTAAHWQVLAIVAAVWLIVLIARRRG